MVVMSLSFTSSFIYLFVGLWRIKNEEGLAQQHGAWVLHNNLGCAMRDARAMPNFGDIGARRQICTLPCAHLPHF